MSSSTKSPSCQTGGISAGGSVSTPYANTEIKTSAPYTRSNSGVESMRATAVEPGSSPKGWNSLRRCASCAAASGRFSPSGEGTWDKSSC
eukprot:CAMPEP_0185566108 /NCGR_PEP_ID=MMETSP1381-20130426/65946_1 /TAXON_ID=298111 /ORGANISM="Pavlova sp., Strain CCMP459" /LENGTH=89 /DNA_ID=CAMNT_0028180057 /DNA_START=662 /DNA_END=931 /DNA_ORIENTATION=+